MCALILSNTGRRIRSRIDELTFVYKPYLAGKNKKSLPDFIIIGAQKSGTTTLWYNLKLHPAIHMAGTPRRNEIQFFAKEKYWRRGTNWYKGHFPHPDCLQGEKSPNYLFLAKCHDYMHQIVPGAKLIILLRNPVDRAYSHWNHFNQVYETQSKRWGWHKTDFETALKSHQDIIKRGEYIDQIERLLTFFPSNQVYIGIAERLRTNPEQEIAKIFSFLDVPEIPIQFTNRHNRSYPHPMKTDTRDRLNNHYKRFNERLFDLLGERVAEWS